MVTPYAIFRRPCFQITRSIHYYPIYNIPVKQLRSAEWRINHFKEVLPLLRRFQGYFVFLRLRKSNLRRIKITKTFKRNLQLVLYVTARTNERSYIYIPWTGQACKISIFMFKYKNTAAWMDQLAGNALSSPPKKKVQREVFVIIFFWGIYLSKRHG